MAALSLSHSSSLQTNLIISSIQGHQSRSCARFVLVCCQRSESTLNCNPKETKQLKEEKQLNALRQIHSSTEKFMKGLKDNMSPKHKGDWKDVMLMSLAFAVYVYISQQLVCAYCAWNSMIRHPW